MSDAARENPEETIRKATFEGYPREVHRHPSISQTGGPGDTYSDMSNLSERLAKLEGGNDTLKWAVGAISAALIGLAAVILVLQTVTISQVSSLSTKVEALPDQINRNLLELNRTLSSSITATQGNRPQQPTVIVVPSQPAPMALTPQKHDGG